VPRPARAPATPVAPPRPSLRRPPPGDLNPNPNPNLAVGGCRHRNGYRRTGLARSAPSSPLLASNEEGAPPARAVHAARAARAARTAAVAAAVAGGVPASRWRRAAVHAQRLELWARRALLGRRARLSVLLGRCAGICVLGWCGRRRGLRHAELLVRGRVKG